MKSKLYVVLLGVIMTAISVCSDSQIYNDRNGGILTEIVKNEWKPVNSADENEELEVTVKESYLGGIRIYYCKAIFLNGSQYKLVSPVYEEIIINYDNITDIKIVKIITK